MPRPRVSSLARSTLRVDRTQFAPVEAARCAVGVVIPLAVGVAVGRPLVGLAIASGALSTGFASFQGVYRTRLTAVLLAAAAMGASTFAGAVAGRSTASAILAVAVWGFVAGLLVALGQAATVVGLQAVVALLIVGRFPMNLSEAALRGGLVALGGILQSLLVVALWPLRRFPAERRALAGAYRELATYAAGIPDEALGPPSPALLSPMATTLRDPQPLARYHQLVGFRGLYDEADRLRMSLAALADTRHRLSLSRGDDTADLLATIDTVAGLAGGVLHEVANAVENGRGPQATTFALTSAATAVERVRVPAPQVAALAAALLGQVRAVVRLAGLPAAEASADEQGSTERAAPLPRPPILPIRDGLATLAANLSLRSTACRHAIRLAVALTVASVADLGLPSAHAYWAPLTTLVVLKPDFGATVQRGLDRLVGTVAGAALASLVAAALHPGSTALTVLVAVFAAIGFAVFRANYAAYSVSITALIVFLLAFTGLPELGAVTERTSATALGGAIALLAYFAWPTFTAVQVPDLLADLIAAQADYLERVLAAYDDPEVRDRQALRDSRTRARLARSNAEAAIERMASEPTPRNAPAADVAVGMLSAARRFALTGLAVHAHLSGSPPLPSPELRRLRAALVATMRAIATAIRTGEPLGDLPPLREAHHALAVSTQAGGDANEAILTEETDHLVDTVNTMAELVQRLHPSGRAVQWWRVRPSASAPRASRRDR